MASALAPLQRIGLAFATTNGLSEVMGMCREQVGAMHSGMGVVFQLNEQGQVNKTWTRNGTEYEQCFATAMKDRIHYEPPTEPFYTAVDYGRGAK